MQTILEQAQAKNLLPELMKVVAINGTELKKKENAFIKLIAAPLKTVVPGNPSVVVKKVGGTDEEENDEE
jgi:hypothetical protein